MLFQFCISIALAQVIGTNLAKHDSKDTTTEGNKEETEAIFASVIKNITRVNNVLQELISNYEYLQKIYKSQENLEAESSDGEIDEVFKSKKDGGSGGKVNLPSTPASNGYPATQMIWSENEGNEGSDVDNSGSDSDNSTENKTVLKIPARPLEPANLQKAEIIFVDTHKSATKKKKRKNRLEPILENVSPAAPKTRYSKVSDQQGSIGRQKMKKKKDLRTVNSKVKKVNNPSKGDLTLSPKSTELKINVEKKIQSETFSPMNIWDDIMSNKPIRLEAHSEVTFEKLRKDNNDKNSKEGIKQRSRDIKPPSFNLTKTNRTEKSEGPSANSDTDIEDGKEEFQATVLREAYGDACLKVVVKKCYKACKDAGKDICERFKCKSNYKEKYNSYIKRGCIKEFHGNTSNSGESVEKNNSTKKDVKNRAATTNSKNDFQDITRNGYLRSCFPHLIASRRSGDLTIGDTWPSDGNQTTNFNILRDKYEKACQKMSYGKCKNACEYGYKHICKSFTCNKSRKSAYKKKCNQHCKRVYKKGKGSSSSSDSSSSSSSSNSDSSDGSSSD